MKFPRVLIFDHIAKCGGTSVQNVLLAAGCSSMRLHAGGWQHKDKGDPSPLLLSAHETFKNLSRGRDLRTFYFTILRHPVDCFYSQIFASKLDDDTFAQAVDRKLKLGVARIIEKFAISASLYDFVGILEDWRLSIAELSRLTGLTLRPSVHHNPSGRPNERPREDELTTLLLAPIATWQAARAELKQ